MIMTDRFRDLMRLIKPYRGLLGIAFVAMLIQGVMDLLDPWPLKIILDNVIGDKALPHWLQQYSIAQDKTTLAVACAGAVILIAVIGSICGYWESYLSTTAGQRVMHDLRHTLYHHVQRMSLSFYEKQTTGDMVVRLTSDIDAAQDFVSSVLLGIILDVLTLIGILGVMFYLDWHLTLIAISVTPILGFVTFRLTKRIKKAAREVKKRESELASVVQESITSIRVIKAFAREDYEEDRLDRQSMLSVTAALRARSYKARLSPMIDIITAFGTCLVLAVGARFVLNGELTPGDLIVFVAYLGRLYKPIKDLSKMTDTLSKAAVSFERIGEIMRTESAVADKPDARPAPALNGLIAVDQVTFGYSAENPILKDVSLVIQPGQSAALVGLTGSGKSTLLSMIPRFYDPLAGQIRIDDRPIQDFTLKSLRDQISIVLQESVLFRASICANIAYGSAGATRQDVINAAMAANAHEFIVKLPDGYDTVVGERGDTLSGGQRQRIAIARAIIRNTPILLLDEPSAALDPQSEELIFEAIGRLMKGRTSITIAHRLATIRRADVIFVLDEGKIVERGTHEELLALNGEYARLHRIQFQTRETAERLLTAGTGEIV
jgi:ATP-binding cassette, subfamily B, bacterial